jgi:pimeloyl-ACP methyl ester carboxylesterase
MKGIQRFPKTLQSIVLASVVLAGTFGTAITAAAQDVSDLQTPKGSLVLQAQGSFFMGGETVSQTATEIGGFGGGHIAINQMYVQYIIPQGGGNKVPVVMVHGGTLSGKTYETTPDGRMGWNEYFVRQGHAVYVPDQVSRARSGFNQAVYNDVRAGVITPPSAQPNMTRLSNETNWTLFRFGATCCVPFPDTQFPIAAVDKFAKQAVPDLNSTLATPNPTFKALSDLAIQVKGAVVMGHSESGAFPVRAALINSTGTKGLILIEGFCPTPADTTDQQIAQLVNVPILTVFGDHMNMPLTGFPGLMWQDLLNGCNAFNARVNAAGGNAQMLHIPDLGIHGNSHMMMQDKNNLQVADLILKWIDANVDQSKVAKK